MKNNKDFYDELYERSLTRLMWTGAAVLVGILVCLLISSCKTQYVPVETIKTEYITNTVHDSVYFETVKNDSIVIREKGDTIFVDRWHTLYQDRWRERLVTDTLIKIDSIQVPYPVEKKKLGFWEKARYTSLGMVCTAVLAGIVGVALWLRRRYRRG